MAHSQTVRWISSPVETVFGYIRNPFLYTQWLPNIRAVHWPVGELLAIGEIGVIRAGQRELQLLITGYAENRLLELELCAAGGVTRELIEVESALGGTRVIHSTAVTLDPASAAPWQGRLPPTRKVFDDLIGALKRALEARHAYSTGSGQSFDSSTRSGQASPG
jgi:hypothetical protein